MKKLGLLFSVLCCFATSFSFAQGGMQNAPADSALATDGQMDAGVQGGYQDRRYDDRGYEGGWDRGHQEHGYRQDGYQGGYDQGRGAGCEQPCAPVDKPVGDCYCLYCKSVPCYYNKWHCEYVPEYGCKKCCRMVDECYQKQCCRMVPQYYCKTCTRKVPQYYYEKTCRQVPKYTCEKCCKWEKKYYYKHSCAPTCTADTCVEQR